MNAARYRRQEAERSREEADGTWLPSGAPNRRGKAATGPPVIAEGYQDNSRLSDYYSIGRIIRMESYPTRFLTARQERTEVVTRESSPSSLRFKEDGVF